MPTSTLRLRNVTMRNSYRYRVAQSMKRVRISGRTKPAKKPGKLCIDCRKPRAAASLYVISGNRLICYTCLRDHLDVMRGGCVHLVW